MRKLWSRRPSPAMVVACIALLVALGGTSVAAVSQLARNSVGPAQLQFAAVTSPKIRTQCGQLVEGCEPLAAAGGLRAGPASGGADRTAGPCGPDGRRPAQQAPRASIGAITVRTAAVSVVDGAIDGVFNTGRIERRCEGNERAISAGTSWGDDGADLKLVTQEVEPLFNPQNQLNGFVAVGGNDSGESSNFTVHVFCFTP